MSISKTCMLVATTCALWLVGCHQSFSPEVPEAATVAPGKFVRKVTAYFSIGLPTNWTIEEQATEEADTDASFKVLGPEGNEVFTVTVATDEPRFIPCFCAPWEEYTEYDKDGIKYADLTMNVGGTSVRTLKAVGVE